MKKVVFLIAFALMAMACEDNGIGERKSPEDRTENHTVQESSDIMRSRE